MLWVLLVVWVLQMPCLRVAAAPGKVAARSRTSGGRVKAAVPGLFVNARTDTHWLGDGDESATFRRLDAYQQAGADGVFVPGLTEPARIATLAKTLDVPLNILYSPSGPTVTQLGDLGVRRVSLGSLLYRRALGAALETAVDIRAGHTPSGSAPAYHQVEALSPRREG